ncbi:MAG: NUDIX hydrolase [Phycisphaeraceae bacterium]|nr:NUDIX hydrolase [Phycisphaeraceae bacterium]
MTKRQSQSVASKERDTVFSGSRFDVDRVEVETDGKGSVTREMVVHPGAVAILPIFDDTDSIVMIRNERFAVGESLWELPAGTLEPSEDPFDCAGRELIEETGYKAASLTRLTEFYTTPGFCNERMLGYLAEGLEHVGQDLEAGEKITVEPLAYDRVIRMIENGDIRDGKTIALLLLYDRFRRDRGSD